MAKAQLVTRATTSGTNTENLNKGSALTHAEMDKNLIVLRDAGFGIADDTSTVLSVTDDKTITIAGGSNITTALSGDTLTITGAAAPITALNNKTANRLTTIGSTTTELDGEANLTFDGSTLAVTGNITATTSIANDAVTLDDNGITASRSNDHLELSGNGTGRVEVGETLDGDTIYSNWFGTSNRIRKLSVSQNISVDADTTDRLYTAAFANSNKLTNGSTSNSNWRPRTLVASSVTDLDGNSYTRTGNSRGPNGINIFAGGFNSNSSSASTLHAASGVRTAAGITDYDSPSQNITLNNALGLESQIAIEGNGSSDKVITDGYGVYSTGYVSDSGSGSSAITNFYAFYTPGTGGTNNYAFYSNSDTAESALGTIERYRETINALTNSSTITVDCSLAPVHTVTIAQATGFNFKNLGTGQTATVVVKQDGTGSRTATFTEEDSTAIKFQGGAPTLSTGANAIDVITVFNTGSEVLGNCAKAYA